MHDCARATDGASTASSNALPAGKKNEAQEDGTKGRQ